VQHPAVVLTDCMFTVESDAWLSKPMMQGLYGKVDRNLLSYLHARKFQEFTEALFVFSCRPSFVFDSSATHLLSYRLLFQCLNVGVRLDKVLLTIW